MKVHDLKIEPPHFQAIILGLKKAEVRKNDRDYQPGDWLLLREYLPVCKKYTGKEVRRRIAYVTAGGEHGIKTGYVLLSLSSRLWKN